jgi:hypothetical protein
MSPQRQRGFLLREVGRGTSVPFPKARMRRVPDHAKGYPPFRILTRLRLDHRDTQSTGFELPVVPG